MKNKTLLFLLATFMFACDNAPVDNLKEQINQPTEEIKDSIAQTHEHSHEIEAIELNAGVKWKVLPEMLQHIRNMESAINRFTEINHVQLKDYAQLGASLQKSIDLLTSNCTMEGKAHDELHKWLLPYIDMVDKLNKSKNDIEAQSVFKDIKNSFIMFNKYFE